MSIYWSSVSKSDGSAFRDAAKSYDVHYRKQASLLRRGQEAPDDQPLCRRRTLSAEKILGCLINLAINCAEKVYPTYAWLQEQLGLSREAIADAIKQLITIGVLERQRRCRRLEADGPGPWFEQTSNAYRLRMPEAFKKLLPRWRHPAPTNTVVMRRLRRRCAPQWARAKSDRAKSSRSACSIEFCAGLGRRS